MLGHRVGDSVTIAPNLVLKCGQFTIGDGVKIAPFNVFRTLSRVDLGDQVELGSWNWIGAAAVYQRYSDQAGRLTMARGAFLTSRHYLDCSGVIEFGEFSGLGGQRTMLQSHEMDVHENRQTIGAILIGERALVSTGCILLKDAVLPPRSVLAAGSTLAKWKNADIPQSGLWGGTPARYIKEMTGAWFDRTTSHVEVAPGDVIGQRPSAADA